ncbi:hypothetical protein TBLA_0C07020 [Henningerozyma blattae CBS 6284]|uniref:ubiquitinyl hydrolase 1 n=1 Tax=Henningerozyma blattae (strain ATCC 34711 / CBS 6284 / DSM 70876 / NBRC 10599 / NRRL Y-10934 / UCD 77-7) TaxID=1071380 RepID=I2H291_HENB6|nr:hypothetical protein TBLA_0C07020 [Tetrapisispora blattae CBS 6284]CCH60493.1 hypothetical protein TBLA_0C07020 [Tetrapisispora blattae CBS 6284]
MSQDDIEGAIQETVDIGLEFDETLAPMGEECKTLVEGSFTWHIDNWSSLNKDKYVSPRYKIGDFDWDVLLFPQGNHNKSLAIYLEPHPEERPVKNSCANEKMPSDDSKNNENRDDDGDVDLMQEKSSDSEIIVDKQSTGQNDNDDAEDSSDLSVEMEPVNPDWYVCAQFAVVISRPGHDKETHLVSRSHHRFNATDTDWGFSNIVDLYHLKNSVRGRPSGFINGDDLNISVYVRVLEDPTGVLWHNFINYDSKKETGYVGFRNQGATCYLNSLLQSYFFTKYFRDLVYQIPTADENPNDSVALALQRAFYQLQVSNYPLDTLELTRSFGWDTAEAFTQHDVQELNRILMDRLESRMKGTSVEGKLTDVFVGKMKSYIKCVNIDYESSRVEDFWDIQLNVKGLEGLANAFENYIEVELMDGENQYAAQDYGLQDAKKGVVFESFPEVLHLQLKRFEYDFNYDQLVKVNDRFEFPETIDLSPYMDKEVLKKQKGPNNYNLHGVLVHTGDISTGHYYAMIKPTTDDKWYRFDDEKVWRVTKKQVFDENFGLNRLPEDTLRKMTRKEYQDYLIARHTSAYMLVYVKDLAENGILEPSCDKGAPENVVTTIQKENKEREIKEKELREAYLYVTVRLHSISNFINYQGFDYSPNPQSTLFDSDLYDENEYCVTIKVLRTTYIKDLKKKINEKLGIPHGKNVRYWKMAYRHNSTLRLEKPIMSDMEQSTLEDALNNKHEEILPPLDIFVEEPYLELSFLNNLKVQKVYPDVKLTNDFIKKLRTKISSDIKTEDMPDIQDVETYSILFVKVFDRHTQRLVGAGHFVTEQYTDIKHLSKIIRSIYDIPESISLYEELAPGKIEKLPHEGQVYSLDLISGDIISFELPHRDLPKVYPVHRNIEDMYIFLKYRIKVKFTKSSQLSEDYVIDDAEPKTFEFWISALASYHSLAQMVSNNLNVEPDHLKLFVTYPNARYNLKPKTSLRSYLIRDYNCEVIPPFEYEVLSIPLNELEHLMPIKFYWLKNSYIHYQCHEFRVSKNYTVKEFLDRIQNRLKFTDEEKRQILLWTNRNFKFEGVLFENNTFEEIGKLGYLFGRILPDELALVKQYDEQNSRVPENSLDDNVQTKANNENVNSLLDHNLLPGRLVLVEQYFKDIENRHGISFFFNLIPEENFVDTRTRLHAKFGLGQKEFSKIKLAISYTTPTGSIFKSLSSYTDEELKKIVLYNLMSNLDYIFMDHPDRLRSHTTHDRPMVIKN